MNQKIFIKTMQLLSFLLLTSLMIHCPHNDVLCKINNSCPADSEKERNLFILSYLGISTDPGPYYSKLYYADPALLLDPANQFYLYEVSSDPHPAKNKLIILQGWNPMDRSDPTYPPFEFTLRERILSKGGWLNFIQSTEYAAIVAKAGLNMDVYFYDYLSSDPIDLNGIRFRKKMDALFFGQTGTVVIAAHSMGGLVSRFAVYEDTAAPDYLKKVYTFGTPHHGSPWSSPEYQGDMNSIGNIAAFLTNTPGGRDLRWDNFDSSLAGSTNPKLDTLNLKTDRDSLFYAFYGSYTYAGTPLLPGAGKDNTLIAACNVLNPSNTSFNPSDCIVPSSSASFSGQTTINGTFEFIEHDHYDMKLGTYDVRSKLITELQALFP